MIVHQSEIWGPSRGFLRLFVKNNGTNSFLGIYGESMGTFEYSFQLFLPAAQEA